jgi:hypothetical protein
MDHPANKPGLLYGDKFLGLRTERVSEESNALLTPKGL